MNIHEHLTKSTDCLNDFDLTSPNFTGALPMAEILHKASEREKVADVEIGDVQAIRCTFWNDLKVAVEVKLKHGEHSKFHTIYPKAKAQLRLAVDSMDAKPQLSVRLRDDPNVCGI